MNPSGAKRRSETRTYRRSACVVFCKTAEEFGGLSNMAGGFPLEINGIPILTAEALYQACRFPHRPEIQRLIIDQKSPMTAKMKSKPHRADSRSDWDAARVTIMRWCVRAKLVQNRSKFGPLLLSTLDRPIVEESRRDDFWGAQPVDAEVLVGSNLLGRLLMELRQQFRETNGDGFKHLDPPRIPNFQIYGEPIRVVTPPSPKRRRGGDLFGS
ncbi:MAG: NADAR family protein [Planctomycetota bacterium]